MHIYNDHLLKERCKTKNLNKQTVIKSLDTFVNAFIKVASYYFNSMSIERPNKTCLIAMVVLINFKGIVCSPF